MSCLTWLFPAEVDHGHALTFLLQCSYCKQVSFSVYLMPHFLAFLLVIFQSKLASKYRAEVLCSVSKHKKAVMWLTKKIHVLGKLLSGMSYSAMSCEFNVNESAIYSILNKTCLNRNTYKRRLCINEIGEYAWLEVWLEADRNVTLYFPWKHWFSIC